MSKKFILPQSFFNIDHNIYGENVRKQNSKIEVKVIKADLKFDTNANYRPYIDMEVNICAVNDTIVPLGTRETVNLLYQFTNAEISVLARWDLFSDKYVLPSDLFTDIAFAIRRPCTLFDISAKNYKYEFYQIDALAQGSPLIMNTLDDGYSIFDIISGSEQDNNVSYTPFATVSDFLVEEQPSGIPLAPVDEFKPELTSDVESQVAATSALTEDRASRDEIVNRLNNRMSNIKEFIDSMAAMNNDNEYKNVMAQPTDEPVPETVEQTDIDDAVPFGTEDTEV